MKLQFTNKMQLLPHLFSLCHCVFFSAQSQWKISQSESLALHLIKRLHNWVWVTWHLHVREEWEVLIIITLFHLRELKRKPKNICGIFQMPTILLLSKGTNSYWTTSKVRFLFSHTKQLKAFYLLKNTFPPSPLTVVTLYNTKIPRVSLIRNGQ